VALPGMLANCEKVPGKFRVIETGKESGKIVGHITCRLPCRQALLVSFKKILQNLSGQRILGKTVTEQFQIKVERLPF
jgi:hypothetical protein